MAIDGRWSLARVQRLLRPSYGNSTWVDEDERRYLTDLALFAAGAESALPVVLLQGLARTRLRSLLFKAIAANSVDRAMWVGALRYWSTDLQVQLALQFEGEPSRVHFDDVMNTLAMATAAGWLDEVRRALPLVLERLPLGLLFKAHDLDGTAKRPDRQCFPWFTLKLLCDWAGLALPAKLPHHPFPAPEYDALLACWRHPDPTALVQPLLDVCDRHTREAIDPGSSNPSKRVDFGEYVLMAWPIEVHMVFRLRESLGLALPVLPQHPLLATPLAEYTAPWPREADELLRRVVERARRDLPRLRELLPP